MLRPTPDRAATRTFRLRPIGDMPAAIGTPVRTGFLAVDPRHECQVVVWGLRPDAVGGPGAALLLRRPTGGVREEVISAEMGDALLEACGTEQVAVLLADLGNWTVRIFEGVHWGTVLGEIAADAVPASGVPTPPAGWTLGEEVTADPAFTTRALAARAQALAHTPPAR